jgi:hypothetical protein
LADAADVQVIAGEIEIGSATLPRDVSSTRATITARQWKIHENYYTYSKVNDIALIQLPVRVTNTVNIASSFMLFQDLFIQSVATKFLNEDFTVVGYMGAGSLSTMRYINVVLAAATMCNKSPYSQYMDVNQFCVGVNVSPFRVTHYLYVINLSARKKSENKGGWNDRKKS